MSHKSVAIGLLFFLLIGSMAPAAGQDACRSQARLQTEVGERYELGQRIKSPDNEFVLVHPGARYLRALLTSTSDPGCDWSVVVRDKDYRAMQVLGPHEFSQNYRWTERIARDLMYVDLYPCKDKRQPVIVVASYIEMPLHANNPYYSFQDPARPLNRDLFGEGDSGISNASVSNGLRQLGDNVVFVMNSFGRTSWVCSGVMLKTGVLLTNWHCGGVDPLKSVDYWNENVVRDLVIDISWDGDQISRELYGVRLLHGSEALDYALLEVDGVGVAGAVVPLAISQSEVLPGDKLYVIHHTEGMPKQISTCKVDVTQSVAGVHLSPSDFEHSCDTEKGSSGSPVFNQQGLLVGLHHEGFALDDKCKTLDKENKAVRISEIMKDLKANDSALYLRIVQ